MAGRWLTAHPIARQRDRPMRVTSADENSRVWKRRAIPVDYRAIVVNVALRESSSALGQSVLDLIGNTPMLSFQRVTKSLAPVTVLAKAEWYNPGGSVKDRAAMAMIL